MNKSFFEDWLYDRLMSQWLGTAGTSRNDSVEVEYSRKILLGYVARWLHT